MLASIARGAALFYCADLFAATCTWTGGGADVNWSNPGNWDTCAGIRSVPLDTDTLIFPDGVPPASKTNVNNLGNLKPSTIRLEAKDYDISGNAITLSTAIVTDTDVGFTGPKFGLPINLSSGATFDCQAGYFVYLTGALNIGTFGFVVDGTCNTSLKGPVSGSGGLYKYGTGTLYMQTGANTYTGTTTINGGTIYVGTASALGAAGLGNGTIIKSTTTLTLYLGVTLPESLTLAGGTLDNFIDDNRVTGNVTLTAESFVSAYPGTRLTLAGPLAGNRQDLNKLGAGTVVIDDASALGEVVVGGGTLELNGSTDAGLSATASVGTLAGTASLSSQIVLQTSARVSPGTGAGKNPGTLSAPRCYWNHDGIMEFQLGSRADRIDLGITLTKVGSGAFPFEFHDGSTPPKVGVSYPLITYPQSSNFNVADFSFTYVGTGPDAAMTGNFVLTLNGLAFTPLSVTSDLIFRDGVEP